MKLEKVVADIITRVREKKENLGQIMDGLEDELKQLTEQEISDVEFAVYILTKYHNELEKERLKLIYEGWHACKELVWLRNRVLDPRKYKTIVMPMEQYKKLYEATEEIGHDKAMYNFVKEKISERYDVDSKTVENLTEEFLGKVKRSFNA